VREWLKSLDSGDRRIIGEDIKPHGCIARVLFCAERECMVLLHGFIKKTQRTPKREIDLAINRKMMLSFHGPSVCRSFARLGEKYARSEATCKGAAS
jgi:hypothetical protein